MDAVRKTFAEKTAHLQEPIISFLEEVITNPKVKIRDKLKACSEVLSRTVPTIKSIDHTFTKPVVFEFVSPQEAAQKRLTELNDEQKQHALEGLTIHNAVNTEAFRVVVDPDADAETLDNGFAEETM